LAPILFLAACLIPANAGTITVMGSTAVAGPNINPLLATYDTSSALASAKAVADVDAGHLGVFVSVAPGGFANADAAVYLQLSFQDMTATDLLEMDMSIHGTFTNGGANVTFYVDDGTDIHNLGQLSCGTGTVLFHGVDCFPSDTAQVFVPLSGVDSLTLSWVLLPGIGGNSGTVDFFNSANFSLIVPDGTTIVNNPGGTLFQNVTPVSAVPEPGSRLLFACSLIFAALGAKRLRRRIHS
jgi:hypothetical protein